MKDPVTRREEGATRTRMAPRIMTLFTGSLEIPFRPYSIPMKVSWLSLSVVLLSRLRLPRLTVWSPDCRVLLLLSSRDGWGRKVIPVSVDPRKGVYGDLLIGRY